MPPPIETLLGDDAMQAKLAATSAPMKAADGRGKAARLLGELLRGVTPVGSIRRKALYAADRCAMISTTPVCCPGVADRAGDKIDSVAGGAAEWRISRVNQSLQGINLLADEDAYTIEDLEKLCTWRTCVESEVIFDRTDRSNDVYMIVSGSVRVVGHAKSGQQVAFVDLSAGHQFGELSAIDGQERSATLYALEETLLAIVPGDEFVAFVRLHPRVGVRLMQNFAAMIRTLNNRVVGLSSTTDIQRIYNEILQMIEPDPENPSQWIIKFMPNHREFALWTDTSPEVVAQAIGKLFEAEVAKRRFKTLHILDRKKFQAFVTAS